MVVVGIRDGRIRGIYGAISIRVNDTPGYCQQYKSGTLISIFRYGPSEYNGRVALQPEMREVLETLDPEWLVGDWPR